MKFVLGTAQFGFHYGITNQEGPCLLEAIDDILSLAKKENIVYLDTAPTYGESETVLSGWNSHFEFITKIPAYPKNTPFDPMQYVSSMVNMSLERLKSKKIYGILFHHADDLINQDSGPLLYQMALELREQNICKAIGVSVYEPEQLEYILDHYPIDMVQIPLNLFDRRFLEQGYLKKLKKRNIQIFVRSIFLQGLLLTIPQTLTPQLDFARTYLKKYHDLLRENEISPLQAAIRFIDKIYEVDYAVIGVTTPIQLREIILAHQDKNSSPDLTELWNEPAPEILLDPRKWYV